MRLGQVAPFFFGTFIALACGSNGDESKVGNGNGATGNTGSAATGNININTGNGSTTGNPGGGAGSTTVDETTACANSSADGEAIQVDLYFMVDITGSMNCPVPDGGMACDMANGPPASGDSRWSVVSAALKSFIADPQNATLGVGLRFFPVGGNSGGPGGGAACNVNSYANPNVEIGPLATTSQPLTTAINMQMPNGTTPTVPSLTAALDHATAWAKAHPTHRVAVVYATDGQPNGCGVSDAATQAAAIDQAAALALRSAVAVPSIPTYVLGVGPNLANLNKIAANGGTKTAFLVDTSADTATQLSAALASIRTTTALDCTYNIPTPPVGQAFIDGQVNVAYTSGAGTVTTVLQDPDSVTCATGNGWEYNTDKTQILLCGKACNDVKADKGGKIKVLFGCGMTMVGPK